VSYYRAIVGAAHRAVRAVLGQEATLSVGGTTYTVDVVFWEPASTTSAGAGYEAIDQRPRVTVHHDDLDNASITPLEDTVTIGGRVYTIEEVRADGLGRVRLTLSGP
jgi:hypothetical protein